MWEITGYPVDSEEHDLSDDAHEDQVNDQALATVPCLREAKKTLACDASCVFPVAHSFWLATNLRCRRLELLFQ